MGGCQDASVVSRVMCLCVVSSVLLCRFYYVVGGCQAVAMWFLGCCQGVAMQFQGCCVWLPGCCYVGARMLWVVAARLLCSC